MLYRKSIEKNGDKTDRETNMRKCRTTLVSVCLPVTVNLRLSVVRSCMPNAGVIVGGHERGAHRHFIWLFLVSNIDRSPPIHIRDTTASVAQTNECIERFAIYGLGNAANQLTTKTKNV